MLSVWDARDPLDSLIVDILLWIVDGDLCSVRANAQGEASCERLIFSAESDEIEFHCKHPAGFEASATAEDSSGCCPRRY